MCRGGLLGKKQRLKAIRLDHADTWGKSILANATWVLVGEKNFTEASGAGAQRDREVREDKRELTRNPSHKGHLRTGFYLSDKESHGKVWSRGER